MTIRTLTPPQYLVTGEKWESLDPLVRSRLLLAPLFMRKRDLAELRPALAKLAAAGAADKCVLFGKMRLGRLGSMYLSLARFGCWAGHLLAALLSSQPTYADPPLPTLLTLPVVAPRDEWVRAMAQSVGDYDGRLHNDRLLAVRKPRATQHAVHSMPFRCCSSSAHARQEQLSEAPVLGRRFCVTLLSLPCPAQGSKLVGKTVAGLQPLLDSADARLFRPLEVRTTGGPLCLEHHLCTAWGPRTCSPDVLTL